MPFYLDARDVVPGMVGFKSALIVPCRFCPAASSAVRSKVPYIEFFRRLLKTASYEQFIRDLKRSLESNGIKTGIFKSRLLHQFVLCMWTSRRRRKLSDCARNYDALVVLGCEAAVETVRNSIKSTDCQVVPGMESKGIMNVKPQFRLPSNVLLELEGLTPYGFQASEAAEEK